MSLNIAVSALTTNQAAMQVVGHNIANVNTAGYSRQSVSLAQVPGQQLGAGYFGKGVQIEDVRRTFDQFTTREANLAKAAAGADSIRYEYSQRVEALFPIGEGSLGGLLNDALNSWVDVASNPADNTARSVVLSQMQTLTDRIRDISSRLDEVSTSAKLQSAETVRNINELARDIATLNNSVARARGTATAPNDLLDQRDRLIAQLNEKIQVTTLEAEDGTLTVFVAGSLPLVLGGQAASLSVDTDPADVRKQVLQFVQGGVPFAISDQFIGQGELAGLQRVINEDVPQTQAELGRLALVLAQEYNRQQNSGLNLNGEPGANLFSLASFDAVPSLENSGGAGVTVAVDDTSALLPEDYEITYLPDGQYSIQRASDGKYWDGTDWASTSASVGLPQTLDGLTLTLSGSPAVGDQYLVKPAAIAAATIRTALSRPAELAVASPVTLRAVSGNTGNAMVEAVSVSVNDGTMPNWDVLPTPTLTFDGTHFTLNGMPGFGNNLPGVASVRYVPGQPMRFVSDDESVEISLTLRGQPVPGDPFSTGDIFSLEPVTASGIPFNSGNAQAFLDLRDKPVFGDGNIPLSDGYVVVFSGVASRLNEAQVASGFSKALAEQAESRRANQAGVNLDEEAARLLQFQQAYQASAKYLQTVQSIFDTLLSTFR